MSILAVYEIYLIWFQPATNFLVAEKTFRSLAALSEDRPELTCIAVSQASREVTDLWVADIGGAWEVEVVADPERGLYARWGLGLNTSWQMFNPRALYATYALGRDEGIWSRAWGGHKKVPVPAESSASASTPSTTGTGSSAPGSSANGNKWQMGGAFAVDVAGGIRWVHVPNTSEDIVDFNPVLELFGMPPLPSKVVKKRPSPSPSPIPDGQRTLYQTPTPRDPPPRR